MIDMMLDAMNEEVEVTEIEEEDQFDKDAKLGTIAKKFYLDEETVLFGTAMVFLVAGYDTRGATLSFLCYQLAQNPGIQQRLQEEIDTDKDMLDYTTIQTLPYLDAAVHETLRLHPPANFIARVCTIPGTDITLTAKDFVFSNSIGIIQDPKFYPNPENFNPDNFSKEAKASRNLLV